MGKRLELADRLEKQAEKLRGYVQSSLRVVELLQPEMKRFDDPEGPWDTYTVRMSVDHSNSAKKDAAFADDLMQASAILRLSTPTAQVAGEAAEKRVGELEAGLEPFAKACTISNHDDGDVIDDTLAAGKIKWRDLRAARALLTLIAEGR